MRILDSNLTLSSFSAFSKTYVKKESLTFWTDSNKYNSLAQGFINNSINNEITDKLEISEKARKLANDTKNQSINDVDDKYFLELSDEYKQKIFIIEKMIEYLTGKKIKIAIPKKIKSNECNLNIDKNIQQTQPTEQIKKGWGLIFDKVETYSESQKMTFNANGIIRTSDGREINISVDLNMSREYYEQNEIHIRAGDAKKVDPIVINFDGTLPGLTDKKFSFDLDIDGEAEQISTLTSGNGFLAIDLNNDNKINDGSELFGPQTNNGFQELSKYDSDNNGWIDENDSIFDKLRIWTKDENGNDILFALGQKGIGAIYLGNVSSIFDLKNSSNELNGSIANTGIFLKEDGQVGTIHHIDLAV